MERATVDKLISESCDPVLNLGPALICGNGEDQYFNVSVDYPTLRGTFVGTSVFLWPQPSRHSHVSVDVVFVDTVFVDCATSPLAGPSSAPLYFRDANSVAFVVWLTLLTVAVTLAGILCMFVHNNIKPKNTAAQWWQSVSARIVKNSHVHPTEPTVPYRYGTFVVKIYRRCTRAEVLLRCGWK